MICPACAHADHEHCATLYRRDGTRRDELAPNWCDCHHQPRQAES